RLRERTCSDRDECECCEDDWPERSHGGILSPLARLSGQSACNRRDPQARPNPPRPSARLDHRRARDWLYDYLMARMNTSAGFWPLFFDSCFTPRPMNSASPAFQLVLAGLPSSCSEMSAGARAITT